jgi:hypothetical protein
MKLSLFNCGTVFKTNGGVSMGEFQATCSAGAFKMSQSAESWLFSG